MASESENGRGFNKTALTTLKMAVFAPMPSVNMARADSVKPGFLPRTRTAWTIGLNRSLMNGSLKSFDCARRVPARNSRMLMRIGHGGGENVSVLATAVSD